jgi:PAS domain S-box-containing protein
LRASEQQLRLLVENLSAGAVFRKGNTLVANKAVEEVTGYSRRELGCIEDWFRLLGCEQANSVRAQYELDRSRGFPHPRTVKVFKKNGETLYLEVAAYFCSESEVWLLVDVTRRKLV